MLFLLLPSTSPIWPLSALLAILANVGFGASVVAMNAYLPTLAQEDNNVVHAFQELKSAYYILSETDGSTRNEEGAVREDVDSASEPLLAAANSDEQPDFSLSTIPLELKPLLEEYTRNLSRATSRISSTGIALGYFSGIAALIVALIPVVRLKGSTLSLRLAIGLSGAWWALFTLPAWRWLPGSGGDNVQSKGVCGNKSVGVEIIKAWRELGRTLRWGEICKLKNTFLFLASWFLLSDGELLSFHIVKHEVDRSIRVYYHHFHCPSLW